MTTFEKVQALFAEQFECDPATITLDTDMVEDLGADSLDVVELSMTVEDEFGITVEDDQAGKMLKVRYIVEYIDSKK